MKQSKPHISRWLLPILAAVLTVGCLTAAVGISFARYRQEHEAGISFQPEKKTAVYLGRMENGQFTEQKSTWIADEDGMTLSFAVSNATDAATAPTQTQYLRIWLNVSLGAWASAEQMQISLTVDGQTYTGIAEPIAEGSANHTAFGAGWLVRFADESGAELRRCLRGGEQTIAEMTLHLQGISDTGLIRIQAVAETD